MIFSNAASTVILQSFYLSKQLIELEAELQFDD